MSWRVCSTPGCPNLIETPARKCDACARAQRDRARTRGHNPYGTKGHQSFRRQVLARDPYCTCPGDSGRGGCGKHHGLCGNPSTIADHYPYERTELIDMRLNPNDPKFGRGPMQTMPRCKNRQNKTSRLQHQTINRNTVHHDKNSRQHPQGGGVTTTPA